MNGSRSKRCVGRGAPGLLLGALLVAQAASSARSAEVVVGVEDWGLGGAAKGGAWTPLYVELTARDGDFRGRISATVDKGQRLLPAFEKEVNLVRGTRTRHWLYLRTPATMFRGEDYRFSWRLLDGRGREVHRSVWRRPRVLPGHDSLVLVVRTPGLARAGLGALADQESVGRVHVLMASPQTLPDRALGYEGVDVLVWLAPDSEALPTISQRDAILDYVRRGGHLVVAGGAGWQALADPFFAPLLPARPVGSRLAPRIPSLEGFGLSVDRKRPAVLVRLADLEGRVLLGGAGEPVVVRGEAGFGRVTLLALDPGTVSFPRPAGRRRFWGLVLDLETRRHDPDEIGPVRRASIPLVRALNDFRGFKPVNFLFVALFLVIYVVLIGPVDYFVLKRLGRLHWTWVTFPAAAVASSVTAFCFLSTGRVTALEANCVSLVDARAGADEIRGTTYFTMLSPGQSRYTVQLEGARTGALVTREFEMELPSSGLTFSRSTCRIVHAGRRIERLLVRIWDAQTLEASWSADAPELPRVRLALAGETLTGSVTNSTPQPMLDTAVFFRGRVRVLGSIAPGGSVSLERARDWGPGSYLHACAPGDFLGDAADWYWGGEAGGQPRRENAARAARFISLFRLGRTRFGRLRLQDGGVLSVLFDLPARLQLAGLDHPRRALVLYGVPRSFVRIRLVGRRPRTWETSLVRLRVPVSVPGRRQGDRP